MKIHTIGFTKKTAESFFSYIKSSGVSKLIDVRLNNNSQLAGFAKKNDLEFFLKELCGVEYHHIPDLAPTKIILDAYKKHKGEWRVYEEEFLELMYKRNIEKTLDKSFVDDSCLLCSEDKPHHCHRRLVAEYLSKEWCMDIDVKHMF